MGGDSTGGPTVSLVVPTVPDFPTPDSTGLPAGFALRQWHGETRTSELAAGTTEVDGRSCKLIERLDIALGDTGRYLYVDDTCVVLRNVRVTTLGTVENTSAMVQQAETNVLLVVESSVFDGGPNHQRGIQADHGEYKTLVREDLPNVTVVLDGRRVVQLDTNPGYEVATIGGVGRAGR